MGLIRLGTLKYEVVRRKEDRKRMDAGDCECCHDICVHLLAKNIMIQALILNIRLKAYPL